MYDLKLPKSGRFLARKEAQQADVAAGKEKDKEALKGGRGKALRRGNVQIIFTSAPKYSVSLLLRTWVVLGVQ